MTDDFGSIVGCLLIVLICAWAVWFLSSHLISNIRSGTAVDLTLSEVPKGDAPGMFALQAIGCVLFIGANALIAIRAIVVLLQRVAGGV